MGDRGEHGVPERADAAAARGGAVYKPADDRRASYAGWPAAGGLGGAGVACAAYTRAYKLSQPADHDHIPADTVDRGDGSGVLLRECVCDGAGGAKQVVVWYRWRGDSAVRDTARGEWLWGSIAMGAGGYVVAHGVELYKCNQVSAIAAVPADDPGPGDSSDAAAGAGRQGGQCVQGIWAGAAVLLYTAHLPAAQHGYSGELLLPAQ